MRDLTSIDKILESSAVVLSPEEKEKQLKQVSELIKQIRYHMYKKSPAFAIILGQLKLVFTYQIPTFAVDDFNNIYINPEFSATLTPEENLGVLVHEVMHIATLTFFRQKGRDMQVWNICTDYVMNHEIIKAGFKLPKMGLIPNPNGDIFFKDHTGKVHKINIENKNAEWLYNEYLKLPQPPGGSPRGDPGPDGRPGGDPGGDPGNKPNNGDPRPCDENGKPLTPIDDHKRGDKPGGDGRPIKGEEGGDEPNTEAPSMAEVKNMMNKAKNAADQIRNNERSSGRDSGAPGDIAEVMYKHIKSKTDYKMILKDVFKKSKQHFDFRKPSRRSLAVGSFLPKSIKIDEAGDIGIAIDTSGSISAEDINVIMNEVAKLVKQFPNIGVEVALWNSICYYHNKFTSANTKTIVADTTKNIRSGGTELSSVARFYNKNNMKVPKAMIYFTDGHVESKPEVLPKCRNIFMIFSWGDDKTLINAKVGTVYNINL